MNYYFFVTVSNKEGDVKLRALAGQKTGKGVDIDTATDVCSSRSRREEYPTGTVFGSTEVFVLKEGLASGLLFPLTHEPLMPSHTPAPEMMKAYQNYLEKRSSPEEEKDEEEETAPASTLFDLFGDPTAASPKVVAKEDASALFKKKKASKKDAPAPEAFAGMSLFERINATPKYAVPTIDEDGFCVSKDNWTLLLRNILTQTNTLMIGATGCGKTELVMLACRKLGLECNVYNMGTIFDPISELLGVHRIVKGSSVFDYAKFAEDVQKPGVILLDELSRAPATTNNVLFPCLDGRRELPVDMAGGDDVRNIKVHPECVFIATANVGSEYTGTMSMDRALVGRFFPLELEYMNKTDEEKVLMKRCGIKRDDAMNIVAVADSVRNKYGETELSASLSTRETLMAAKLTADGWSALKAMQMTFLPLFEGTVKEGERAVVMQMILSR